jgi:hypothetical protein
MAVVTAGAVVTTPIATSAERDPLAAYRWSSRLVVISAPEAGDAAARSQRAILASAGSEVTGRDLLTVEAYGENAKAVAIRRRLGLPAGSFRAVLVGKDGEAKLVSVEPIPASTLFSTIDAMPMRRDEMRR